MAAFKTGDVVQLKSGGPQMIVQDIAANGMVNCRWFTEDEVCSRDSFLEDCLKDLSAPPPPPPPPQIAKTPPRITDPRSQSQRIADQNIRDAQHAEDASEAESIT